MNKLEYFDISRDQSERNRFKEIRRKLRGFHKRQLDTTLIQDDIYREVDAILFDSNFKYIHLLHYLVKFGIPLQQKLLDALLERTYSDKEFKNPTEQDVFEICREHFPESQSNVHLGGLGGIEMDILLPFRRVNIEVDKVSSPKKLILKEGRRKFLERNFGITVYRYSYEEDVIPDDVYRLCDQIYRNTRKIF